MFIIIWWFKFKKLKEEYCGKMVVEWMIEKKLRHSTHSNMLAATTIIPSCWSWVPVLGPGPGFLETRSFYLHPNSQFPNQ